MKRKAFNCIIPCLLLVGCSTVGHLHTSDNTETFQSKNPNEVLVYSTTPNSNAKYIVLGQVVACSDAGRNAKTTVNLLKKEAGKLGADAIIDLRLEFAMGYWSSGIKATGTAIKINN